MTRTVTYTIPPHPATTTSITSSSIITRITTTRARDASRALVSSFFSISTRARDTSRTLVFFLFSFSHHTRAWDASQALVSSLSLTTRVRDTRLEPFCFIFFPYQDDDEWCPGAQKKAIIHRSYHNLDQQQQRLRSTKKRPRDVDDISWATTCFFFLGTTVLHRFRVVYCQMYVAAFIYESLVIHGPVSTK